MPGGHWATSASTFTDSSASRSDGGEEEERGTGALLRPRPVVGQAESHDDLGAAGRFANIDLAAVVGDDSPTLGQAEAQPATGFTTTEERIEHVTSNLGRDARAIVADDDFRTRAAG